ncbi:uncharacterized protein LOC135369123 [Ornithodoros turicata]|uniref:uncharacterized protein LOC135369123 n=1 Tax=Ornithodoros turicata TaxID=34597 RepID=UPI0031388770
MRLYQDTSFSVLGVLFDVHRTTTANICKECIEILAVILRTAVFWPSSDAVRSCMTKYFAKYPNTRVVLDCTEMKIERPSDLQSRILTYSHYKQTYTAKVLVCETPGGLISYVRQPHGGRTSDTHIVKGSNVLDMCEQGKDAVMVDKGFLIESLCNEKGCIEMIRPPFLKGQGQLTQQEGRKNQSIAQARVHVERLPLKLFPYIDSIITITTGIANLSKPLFSADKFMDQSIIKKAPKAHTMSFQVVQA